MDIRTSNYVQELQEMLENYEDANDILREELEQVKTILINTLLELDRYKDLYIEILSDNEDEVVH